MQSTTPSGAEEILMGRFIATLGTENEDGSIHLTAVWYLFDDGCLYVATSSRTRKARNVAARPKASLMVDIRKPGSERGLVALCTTGVIAGEGSKEINARIHQRYMSEAALADPRVGGTMAAMDEEWSVAIEQSACFRRNRAAAKIRKVEPILCRHPNQLREFRSNCRAAEVRAEVLCKAGEA